MAINNLINEEMRRRNGELNKEIEEAKEEVVEEPIEKIVEEIDEEPIEESAEETVEESAEETVEEPVEEPIEETLEEEEDSVDYKAKYNKAVRYKRTQNTIAGVAGLVLTGALAATGLGWGLSHDTYKSAVDNYSNVETLLENTQAELEDAKEALNNANGTNTVNPELDEVKEALGDKYTEGADLSDTVAGVVGDLSVANLTIASLNREINEVKEILNVNGQEFSENDVSSAVEALVEGLTNAKPPVVILPGEDGISQEQVNSIFESIASSLSDLGITVDDLKDENGNFSTESLSVALTEIVDDALLNRSIIENISNRVNKALGSIDKEDGSKYSLSDFENIEDACDFIYDNFANNYNALLKNFDEKELSDFESANEAIDWLNGKINSLISSYNTAIDNLESVQTRVDELVDENANLKTENDSLKTENEGLKEENDNLKQENEDLKESVGNKNNPEQEESSKEEDSTGRIPVTDSEVTEDSSPNQDPAKDKTGPEESDEMNF